MSRLSITICTVMSMLACGSTAFAQLPPGYSPNNPPLPPPPPSPKIEPVPIPRLGEPAPLPGVQRSTRGSFGDRITKCLDEGAAAGLGPSERAAYSRNCANR